MGTNTSCRKTHTGQNYHVGLGEDYSAPHPQTHNKNKLSVWICPHVVSHTVCLNVVRDGLFVFVGAELSSAVWDLCSLHSHANSFLKMAQEDLLPCPAAGKSTSQVCVHNNNLLLTGKCLLQLYLVSCTFQEHHRWTLLQFFTPLNVRQRSRTILLMLTCWFWEEYEKRKLLSTAGQFCFQKSKPPGQQVHQHPSFRNCLRISPGLNSTMTLFLCLERCCPKYFLASTNKTIGLVQAFFW